MSGQLNEGKLRKTKVHIVETPTVELLKTTSSIYHSAYEMEFFPESDAN